jgi:hypothetical protein
VSRLSAPPDDVGSGGGVADGPGGVDDDTADAAAGDAAADDAESPPMGAPQTSQ